MIITAPSGYGKTTLIRNFLKKQKSAAVVWLSWGQEIVDEVWVWKRFCVRCSEISEELSQKLGEMGLPGSAQEADYVIEIVRSHIQRPACLIIDDYQQCNSTNMNRLVTKLIYAKIPDFHIIIISRVYPELPYEEMFLKGYCMIIDQRMLSLSRAETEEVFSVNGIKLSENELDSICEYTDGWISAVYLSLFDYSRNGRIGTFRSASHLMKTAIFDKLSLEMQNLYMKMSLFESFTLPQAVYVAEADILPVALIETVENYGFMQYESTYKKYHMHALLRTVAAKELERLHIDKKMLYNRSGSWCERNGEPIQAVVNYRNADNYGAILRLLSGDARYMVMETMPAVVNEIFLDMPIDLKVQYPTAWLYYIYSTIIRGGRYWGISLYEEACAAYAEIEMEPEKALGLKGELKIIAALLEFNDLEKINGLLDEAYELLGHQPSRIFRQTLLTYGTPFMTLLYYNNSGGLANTIALEKKFACYHQRLVGIGEGGWDDLFDAEYALLTGDMEKAGKLAQQVQKKALLSKQFCIVISSYYIQFKVLIYLGNRKQLENRIKEFQEFRKSLMRPMLVIDADLVYSYIYASLGEKEKMPDWLANFNLDVCSHVVRNAKSGGVAYGMLLCRTGQWEILDSIADQILLPDKRAKHIYPIIRGYIYKAVAAFHQKGLKQAAEYLQKAIDLAEPDEVRIPFIENSQELVPIMEGIQQKSKFVNSLKSGMEQYRKSFRLLTAEKETVTLTMRERELLELVKTGCRNGDISKQLNIALVTVEKTLTAIYRKLGVTNRAAAVSKWRELQD